MKFLKLVLIGILVVFLAFTGMWLVGVALRVLSSLFWLAVIGFVAVMLWKMFISKGAKQEKSADEPNKLQTPELTLDEYKRKLEAQIKQSSEKR
jgi:hypothetical protein